jgi:diguanylate cyclase (GGDEF)-like protein/PAS domain S-box-containing protein
VKPETGIDGEHVARLDLDKSRLLAAVLAAADDAILITEAEPFDSPHPKIVYANESYCRMTGYTLEEVIGKSPRICQGPLTDRQTTARIRSKLAAWKPFREEILNYRKDGTPFWVELNVRPFADEKGWFTHWVSVQRDVTERHQATEQLNKHARDLEEAHKLAKLAQWEWSLETGQFWFSPEMQKMFGVEPGKKFIGWAEVLAGITQRDRGAVKAAFERIALLGEDATFEYETEIDGRLPQRIWAQGRPERCLTGSVIAVRGICQDVTDRHAAERSMIWNATHDAATALLNIEGLRSEAPSLVARASVQGRAVVLGLVDLDNLKLVNDTLGHGVGDALIAEAARRLKEAICKNGLVARLGGDEFVFMEACNRSIEERCSRFGEIGRILKQPLDIDGRHLDCSASIGIVSAEAKNLDLELMLQNADLAMYKAKEAGRGGHAFFSPDLQENVNRRVRHLDLARLAIGGKLVVPFFQPQVSLNTGRVLGYEALLRLKIGDRIMPPSAVEHAFESVELATRLGDEMLRRVLAQIRLWHCQGIQFGKVALNVSAAELLREDYAERVLAAVARAGVPPTSIEIEVTEGVLLGRAAERCVSTLTILREHGIGIALDDFGTGYASLTHLKSLPITKLKIDREFVRDIAEDQFDAAIVRAVIGLGLAKGLEIVAEGVETPDQAEFLREQGCDAGQGFLFGKAVPGPQIAVGRWRSAQTFTIRQGAL